MRLRQDIPIYNVELWIVVDLNIHDRRREMSNEFGEVTDPDTWKGMACWQGPCFGLFFARDSIDTETIAHEVFHLTHRILEWTNVRFSPTDHESAALLHGYLMELVVRKTKPRC